MVSTRAKPCSSVCKIMQQITASVDQCFHQVLRTYTRDVLHLQLTYRFREKFATSHTRQQSCFLRFDRLTARLRLWKWRCLNWFAIIVMNELIHSEGISKCTDKTINNKGKFKIRKRILTCNKNMTVTILRNMIIKHTSAQYRQKNWNTIIRRIV